MKSEWSNQIGFLKISSQEEQDWNSSCKILSTAINSCSTEDIEQEWKLNLKAEKWNLFNTSAFKKSFWGNVCLKSQDSWGCKSCLQISLPSALKLSVTKWLQVKWIILQAVSYKGSNNGCIESGQESIFFHIKILLPATVYLDAFICTSYMYKHGTDEYSAFFYSFFCNSSDAKHDIYLSGNINACTPYK